MLFAEYLRRTQLKYNDVVSVKKKNLITAILRGYKETPMRLLLHFFIAVIISCYLFDHFLSPQELILLHQQQYLNTQQKAIPYEYV